jgi:hypothetical protein
VPPGVTGPISVPVYRPCGNTFRTSPEPLSASSCRCGRFPTGKCCRCAEPVCAKHSSPGPVCAGCVGRERSDAALEAGRLLRERLEALRESSDPNEIARLAENPGQGQSWDEALQETWERMISADAVRAPDAQIIHLRFRRRLGRTVSDELWSKPAWRCVSALPQADENSGKLWICSDGSVWCQENGGYPRSSGWLARLRGSEWPPEGEGAEVSERASENPTAYVHGSPFLEHSFAVATDAAGIELRARLVSERSHEGRTYRSRYWRLAPKGSPVGDRSRSIGAGLRYSLAIAAAR